MQSKEGMDQKQKMIFRQRTYRNYVHIATGIFIELAAIFDRQHNVIASVGHRGLEQRLSHFELSANSCGPSVASLWAVNNTANDTDNCSATLSSSVSFLPSIRSFSKNLYRATREVVRCELKLTKVNCRKRPCHPVHPSYIHP